MNGFLLLICFLLTGWLACRLLPLYDLVDQCLVFVLFLCANILIVGYTASAASRLSSVHYWLMIQILFFAVLLLTAWRVKPLRRRIRASVSVRTTLRSLGQRFKQCSLYEKSLIVPVWVCVMLLGVAHLIVIARCPPHNWDSMTYHLARMAYYLQQGHLGAFDANYWAQVMHPKNSTLLLIWSWLVSGRINHLQLVQFAAYWVSITAVYGIARELHRSRAAAFFAAGAFGLVIEALLQASTTQNDLVITAMVALYIYFMLRFRHRRCVSYLILAALAAGMGIGTKASFLLLVPCLAVIGLYAVLTSQAPRLRTRLQYVALTAGLVVAACVVFALPAGYLENIRRYGHPIGPEAVRHQHSFEGSSFGYRMRHGTRNMFRFAMDGISLEAWPLHPRAVVPWGKVRTAMGNALETLGLDLEDPSACRAPFQYSGHPHAHEDKSYWGILGFGLSWILVLLALTGFIRSPPMRVLSACFVLFWVIQAYCGPYDPWRGRYFLTAAPFALPLVGVCILWRNKLLRGYVILVVTVASITAFAAVLFREGRPFIILGHGAMEGRAFYAQDRISLMMANRPWERGACRAFERWVPEDAVVALAFAPNSYEFPFFGEGLRRRVIPVTVRIRAGHMLPREADCLVYQQGIVEPCRGDKCLGADWWIRRL